MDRINNQCSALYHEGHIPMCFVYGTPCTYKDREGCEKARELDIRELARVMGCHSQQNKTIVSNNHADGNVYGSSRDNNGYKPADTLRGLEERAK